MKFIIAMIICLSTTALIIITTLLITENIQTMFIVTISTLIGLSIICKIINIIIKLNQSKKGQ